MLPPRPRRSSRSARGFTLIEAVISAGLLGFLAVTAMFFWVKNMTLVQAVNADSAAIADGRGALERLAREIREIKMNPATGAYCISTMTATSLVFNKTVGSTVTAGCGGANPGNANNDIAVSIGYNSGTISLGYAGTLAPAGLSASVLTSFAGVFTITYLDGAYATAGVTATTVRYVQLDLRVNQSANASVGIPIATTTRLVVGLRNSTT